MTDFSYPILNDEVQLPFYVTGVGVIDTEWHVKREEGFPYYQVIYCVRGQGKLIIDGQEFVIEAGQGFYLPKDYPHEYYATQDIWETHWVTFDGREVPELMKTIDFPNWRVYDISNVSAIDAILKKMLYLLKTNYYYSGHQCSAMMYQFLLELNRYVNLQSSPNESYKLKQLQPVIDYIDNHYMEEIELKQLSDVIGLSPQYLCRLFKDCLNLRPFEYLARKRIQEAKTLLLEEKFTINEIARTVGYNDCSYFCAVFKRHEMLSPAEFRTLHKKIGN
ncbi:MAG: AraC family transcriptional regulator [Oscillospiraceae bacterium]|nr:AraC family transcriptional regulator [Oscillospiraceae bacterium]